MSHSGQTETLVRQPGMSGLPPLAIKLRTSRKVRFVRIPDFELNAGLIEAFRRIPAD